VSGRIRGAPARLVYQPGNPLGVDFDDGSHLLAASLPAQLVCAAYWLREGRELEVEFDAGTLVIERAGELLQARGARGLARAYSGKRAGRSEATVTECVTAVATQVPAILEIFTASATQYRTTDPILQLLVETAALRGIAPLLTVSSDQEILAVEISANGTRCADPDESITSNIGDIFYEAGQAQVVLADDPTTVYVTADPLIAGALTTDRKLRVSVAFETDAGNRIRRVMTTSSDATLPAGIDPDSCADT